MTGSEGLAMTVVCLCEELCDEAISRSAWGLPRLRLAMTVWIAKRSPSKERERKKRGAKPLLDTIYIEVV